MSQPDPAFNTATTRRQWLVLLGAGLSGCGGGTAEGPPGTGGTGLFAQGSIGGFGSVIVNGLRFDDSAASVRLDGVSARSSDLRLGMVAAITGSRSASGGTAASIEVWSIAQGVVSSVNGPGQFSLAGMNVQADAATVLDGIASLAQLAAGQRVMVWGLQGGADARSWTATRIAITAATTLASTGYVTLAGNQRFLNSLLLTGPLADGLPLGPLVRVQGNLAADGSLALTGAQQQGTASNLPSNVDCEVAGLVTSTGNSVGPYGTFMLGNYPVDSGGASIAPGALNVGEQVQVSGNWQNGVLKVSKVTLSSEQSRRTVQITGAVEQFNSLASFTVRGQRCSASPAVLASGTTAADIKAGAQVQLSGLIAGDTVQVASLALAK